MSDDRRIRPELPSKQLDYEVGYGKPPVATRFEPGRSGNPRGRPKGARNKLPALNEERLKAIILEEAYRTIKVSEGKHQVTIPMAKAVVRALAVNAARGQLRSQQLFARLLSETERENKAFNDKLLGNVVDYKRYWDEELERRRQLGLQLPDPIPHPDDIIIDTNTGRVRTIGPTTKEEKAEWDRLWDRVEACDEAIAIYTNDLKLQKNRPYRQFIEKEIAHEKRIRASIVERIGEPKRRVRKST
jgi:Family of unknown function (DUF5681)